MCQARVEERDERDVAWLGGESVEAVDTHPQACNGDFGGGVLRFIHGVWGWNEILGGTHPWPGCDT